MKKLIVWALALLFCIIVWTLVIFGVKKVFAGEWAIGERTQVILFDDDNFQHKPRIGQSFNFGYFTKHLGLELETNYGRFKTMKTQWTDGSSFSIIGGTLNLQARLPINNRLTFYGVYGFGGDCFSDIKISGWESINKKSSLASKYGLGAEWSLNKKWLLNGEANYHYSDTGEGSSIDTWGWVFSLGLKYKF